MAPLNLFKIPSVAKLIGRLFLGLIKMIKEKGYVNQVIITNRYPSLT